MASLRIAQHPGMSPGQQIPRNIDCFVIGQASVRVGQMVSVMVRIPAYDKWAALTLPGGSDNPGVPGSRPENTGHPE
jgi:hypothetical protein